MDKIYPEEHIQAIANAIRRKNGKSVNYLTSEMAGAIDQLVSYPEPTGTQTITENGIVDVKDKAYADVNVAGSTAVLISKTITANGGYDAEDDEADGYSDVTVNVPNSYSASDEGKVVSSGALVAQTSTTIIQNGTVDTTLNNEVVVNVAGARIYTDGTEQISSQITDVSNFTKLCDTSVKFGNYGNKVITRLGITDESAHSTLMAGGWNASGACYYDSENQIGAYGGYDFDAGKHLNKAKFWIGRYSGQKQTITATVQYKDASDEWIDITDLEVTTTLPYPTNIFEVTLDSSLTMYGLRWIHKKTPQKTSGNNLTFFGMTLYEAYSIGTYSPMTRGLVRVPDNYDGFGALNTNSVPNGYVAADEGKVVSNGALVAQGSQTITQNGTYDTTLVSELIANVSGGGGGGIITGGEVIFEAMRNALQAYSKGYSAISSVFLSKDSGDRFTCNDRYFERTTNGNVLVLYGDASESGTSGYFGYDLYTDDISKCVGIYSEYGALRDPQTLTTPRGNTYYRLAMGSPWGGSAGSYNVKVSNGGSDIVTLANNNLFTSSSYYSAKMDFIGAVVDAVFFASEQDDPIVLPIGYTRVKWIQGDGDAYINTGITPDADTIATWRGIQVRKSSGDAAEFGSRIAYQNEMYALISNSTSNQYNSNIDFGTQRTQDSVHFVNNGPNEVVYNSPQGSASVNDSAVVSGEVFNGNSYPIYLFTLNNGGNAFGAKSISKVCRFIIEDSNGTVADFIPCIRDNDNAVGMFDVVSQTFFDNAGTGSFSAGDIYYPW